MKKIFRAIKKKKKKLWKPIMNKKQSCKEITLKKWIYSNI